MLIESMKGLANQTYKCMLYGVGVKFSSLLYMKLAKVGGGSNGYFTSIMVIGHTTIVN